ncbi:hypothetical protein HA402_011553 [Bradysia odoriphaga]|nr:hypothetical protein HA402_011553 [Bradysia odoriphaga]
MYALCPPDFFGIGTECYYISQKKENWLDAHFDCKDRKSRLAEPNRYEDRMIRKFLVNNDLSKESKWIGGNYNWAQRKWQWQDGKEFTYQSFSQTPGGVQELQYHCAILNPNLKYRWSASSCVDKHQYICQHRMPYVNEKHRSRIYAKWNQTYPNEQATQVEVVINSAEMLKRGNRQSIPVNGRSTNTQRLSRHRNYLANEWLKKYKSQQIVLNRNAITNEVNLINTPRRKVPQRPHRLAPRRRNPSIGRDDFIQFERNKNVYRPLITNKVDDFDREESITAAPTNSRRYEQTTHPDRAEDPTSPPRKVKNELDPRERKRLEDTKRLLETGRFEHSYTRKRIATTTATATTTTEPSEQIELERDRDLDYRRQQEEEDQERLRDEEIRRNEQRRKAEERRRQEEELRRMEERRQAEERQMEEERLQNQIDEEKLRLEHEEELRRSRLQQEEQRRAEERKRIHDENLREREERMRMRELELKEREEEERKLREDEERRQEENRQRLEDIERQQREEEERKRQEAENKRIEEENKRRKNEELKEKMRQNRVDISNEDQTIDDLRLKEKLRREKNARMRERLSKLSPEEQLKFFELRRRNKKNSETQQK